MSTVRLTNSMRDAIRHAVLQHRFAAEEEALDKTLEAMGAEVRRALMGPAQWAAVEKAPKGWLPHVKRIRANFAGVRHEFVFPKHFAVPFKFLDGYDHRAEIAFPADHALSVAFDANRKARRALEETRSATRREIAAVLHSATTVKRLLEVWPEVKPFLPEGNVPLSTALTIPIADLNRRLGLV